MALEPNPNLHPPLGYTHKEGDGTKFRGSSWADVANKVRVYREQHGKPAGDVLADIYAQACKNSPSYCRDAGKPRPPSQPRPPRTPDAPRPAVHVPAGKGNVVARATNWINAILGLKRKGGVNFVSTPEARRRVSICAACPKQSAVTGSCGGCMSVLKAAKGVILAGHAQVEKPILGCKVCGEDCSVSVYIVQPPLNDPELPENCWRRQG